MHNVTQLKGGRAELLKFRKRVRRSYGMGRITLEQHTELNQAVDHVEQVLDAITEENNGETNAAKEEDETEAAGSDTG